MRPPDRFGERERPYADSSYEEGRRAAARPRGPRDPRAFEDRDDEFREPGAFADEPPGPFAGSRAHAVRGHPRDPYDRGDTVEPVRRRHERDADEYEPRDPGRWRAQPRFDPDEGFPPGRRSPWDDMEDWQKPWEQSAQPRAAGWRDSQGGATAGLRAREHGVGPFSGRGPKDYRRSDERLLEEVCDRLTDHGQIDASEITVTVREGEVTLQGRVPERHMKRLAEDCAECVSGVQQVHNQLRIENGRTSSASGDSAGSGGELRSQRPLVR